ncbi:hypothetical protein [Candidatus Palauibacter sp.]|uniref:hypothetical protein n=1 Tax=Candidatus Palauibacter sp. TaxID=3101350 RepID=UPI003CC51E83
MRGARRDPGPRDRELHAHRRLLSFNAVEAALEAASWSRMWFRRLEACGPLFDDELRAWFAVQHRDARGLGGGACR